MEWWRDEHGNELTRDYFRVESRRGRARLALPRRPLRPRDEPTALVPAWAVRMSNSSFLDETREAPMSPAYAELAVTTNFSFLRGASHPEELVEQAKALGLAGLGIADRNRVAGVVRAHVAACAKMPS